MRTVAHFRCPRGLVAVACLLAAALPAGAQSPVRIAAVRVGLPPANPNAPTASPVCKFATWAPVYVEVEVTGPVAGPAELVVESPDADGVMTTLAVPLDAAETRGTTRLHYLRPAGGTGEITVTARAVGGAALSEPFRVRSLRPRDANTYVVLGLGSRLPGFELPKLSAAGSGETESPAGPLRGGRLEVAAITDVALLPDQWFGYDAADLVVLTTGADGAPDFLSRLFSPGATPADQKKRAALLEWVRRGGRLVVSLGSTAGAAAGLPALQELLPFTVPTATPTRAVERLPLYWSARETSQTGTTVTGTLAAKAGTFPVANLAPKPGRAGRTLVPPPGRQTADPRPVVVQSGYGLGRVTLVAFDLDRPPFTEFGPRAEVWDWVLREGGANRASGGIEPAPLAATAGPSEAEDEVAVALRTHGDTFDGVPVVSFSWVAILIVGYILLIGPVEYYFLKRVFGRPELTWVTFPVVVLAVSALAYTSAAAAKGRELRVNQTDVVEVTAETDPRTGKPGGRVFGTTWFTVFSPRIDTYTIGATPADGWTAADGAGASLVGWVGSPRGGRAGLLRRRYAYHTDPAAGAVADGLDGVPIQVWSTKAFTANWTGALDPAAPAVESRLEHPPGDPGRAIGTFVNRTPFGEVADCVAFYAGQAFPVGTVLGGQEVRLVLDRGVPATQWLQENAQLGVLLNRAGSGERVAAPVNQPAAAQPSMPTVPDNTLPLLGMLFHEATLRNEEGVVPRNASLRRLDQSWRLAADNRDEVIVVGRVPAGDPGAAARLWLKGLPSAGTVPPSPATTGRRETYVRLYLPVRPAAPAP